MSDRNRVVTPATDPDRFTDEERALFNQGKCGWLTEFGNWGAVRHCQEPSKPGASFGNCADHERDLLENHWPDGSRR